jgi:hypothetical protein
VGGNGLSGFWVNATAGVTLELVPGAGGASHPAGFNAPNNTVRSGEILFSGLNASCDMGLWVSNGRPPARTN